MKRFWMSFGGLATIVVLFFAFNVVALAWLRGARVDMTANKLYTLSDGTRNLLSDLDEPITLRFYFSRKLAQKIAPILTYGERVQQMLTEYASASKGKIKLIVADPLPFTEVEDEATANGLRGTPASASGELFYFGLVGTNTTDGKEIIGTFPPQREEFLEYDITRLIDNLRTTKKKVVGILTALPMDGNPMARMMNPQASTDPWYLVESMRQSFDVRMIDATTEKLEKDLDVLFVVHPQNLSPQTLFEIDQYVLNGGKLVAFLDPYYEAQEVRQDPQNPLQAMMADRSSKLDPLLSTWGLDMSAENLAGDKDLALGAMWQGRPVDYVLWLALRKDKDVFDAEDVTTSELSTLHMGSPGFLRKKDGATTTVTPLVQTTRDAMQIPKSQVQFGPQPADLLASYKSGGERLMLAARVTGNVTSAFPDGRPAKTDGEAAPAPDPTETVLKDSKGPINVVVVADVDMLGDRWWVRTQNFAGQTFAMMTSDNGTFAENVADNLSGSSDLISLRSRGRSLRPFDTVDQLRKDVDAKFRAKEKELEAKVNDLQQRLNELQGSKDESSAMILSPEQEAEFEKYVEERTSARKELRAVKADLQKDIDGLKTRLVLANAFLVPALIALAGIGVWGVRRKKMIDARTGRAGS